MIAFARWLPAALLSLACITPVRVAAAPATVIKGNHVMVSFGGEQAPHARITFNKNRAAREAILIETFQVGAPGSKLTILVDNDANPVFAHTFTIDDCKAGTKGNACTIRIGGQDAMPGVLRNRFSNGRVSHIRIETGDATDMSQDAVLEGFAGAIKGKSQ